MAGNSIGELFRLTSFGESHGKAVGGIIDGCPAGIAIDYNLIKNLLYRRRTNILFSDSDRNEADEVVFLSGINDKGISLGSPIAFYVKNTDTSSNYEDIKDIYRPSHADFTYDSKYGIRDYKGGGRASARETVSRVIGGAIAMMLLNSYKISIKSYTCQIGPYRYTKENYLPDFKKVDKSPVACPDEELSERMINYLARMKREKDSTGGAVVCIISGVKAGLGEPVFDKLHADLAKAIMSIPAAKAFEYGMGSKASSMKGSEHNDPLVADTNNKNNEIKIKTLTNHSGGIVGGISNAEDIYFKVSFKPIPSIGIEQNTIDKHGNTKKIELKGHFDICAVPRVLPVVESMAAIVIADHLLRFNTYINIK